MPRGRWGIKKEKKKFGWTFQMYDTAFFFFSLGNARNVLRRPVRGEDFCSNRRTALGRFARPPARLSARLRPSGCSHPAVELSSDGGCLLRYGMSSVSLLQLCLMFNPKDGPACPARCGSYVQPGSGKVCVCDTPIHPPALPHASAGSPFARQGLTFL